MKKSENSSDHTRIKKHSFALTIVDDSELRRLRLEYEKETPERRRMAAQWEYDSAYASQLFERALWRSGTKLLTNPMWPVGFSALAIDPKFAPAILTVGSTDYINNFKKEALEHFLSLTTLKEEDGLSDIIDKAGDFLLDNNDFDGALSLYLAAESAFPSISLYCIGSGYCLSKLGKLGEAIRKFRRAVELDPLNYFHLNDLVLQRKLFNSSEFHQSPFTM
jgi:tetratricopeptide (TPR) repeat protein